MKSLTLNILFLPSTYHYKLQQRVKLGHHLSPGVECVQDVGVAPGERRGGGLGSRVLVYLLVYAAPVTPDVLPQPGHHRVSRRARGLGQVKNCRILV